MNKQDILKILNEFAEPTDYFKEPFIREKQFDSLAERLSDGIENSLDWVKINYPDFSDDPTLTKNDKINIVISTPEITKAVALLVSLFDDIQAKGYIRFAFSEHKTKRNFEFTMLMSEPLPPNPEKE